VAEPTSRERAEAIARGYTQPGVLVAKLAAEIAAAIDTAVAERDARWQAAVGMSLETAESLASDPGAA
jgi:hypothetical protein